MQISLSTKECAKSSRKEKVWDEPSTMRKREVGQPSEMVSSVPV